MYVPCSKLLRACVLSTLLTTKTTKSLLQGVPVFSCILALRILVRIQGNWRRRIEVAEITDFSKFSFIYFPTCLLITLNKKISVLVFSSQNLPLHRACISVHLTVQSLTLSSGSCNTFAGLSPAL